VQVCVARHWAQGGAGAAELAAAVVAAAGTSSTLRFAYEDGLPLVDKIRTVARRVYHADDVELSGEARRGLDELQAAGHGALPVCIAKTQYSFASDPKLRGAPTGHRLTVREVRLSAGAGFVVAICGDLMTMPGLPQQPAAEKIDLTDDGRIVGLS
jgi:formate--tetrahydrofolate ligase